MVIVGVVDDIRGIQDRDAGSKRKEDPSSSNSGNKQKTYISHGSQGQGQGHQDQGQIRAFSQARQTICYLCRQPGQFRWDCPQRQETQKVVGQLSPNHQWDELGLHSGWADGVLPLPVA